MSDISGLLLTVVDKTVFGNKRVHTYTCYVGNGTDTWPAAGVQCPASNFNLGSVDFVDIEGGTLKYVYQYTSSCVQAYNHLSGNAIVATGSVPTSGVAVRLRAFGAGLG